ncbi:MAG: 50S ribosomal protein L10 [Clostridia bacterium]|nr:50S ribosomal protein L10 [Clostridia bacterium]
MPSKVILEQKQKAVAELAEKMRNAASGVLVNYQGITVEDDTKMRSALRAAGVEYMVVKNTMTGRACDEVGFGEMKQYLSGMTAIAISAEDPIAPAKVLKQYADKVESFKILAGFLDGAVVDEKTVNELADIPSKDVLIAKLLGSLQSPLYGLAYVLQAKIDKENGGDAAEAPAEA